MTVSATRPRHAGTALTLVSAVAAFMVLLSGTALAVVPVPPVRLPTAIEGFATYQKQTTCSPTAKPGTVKLKNLILKTYPGTRNGGISRSCSAGGASEHKEGRAFDWGVRVSNASERAKAQAFLTWLLKTDARGNRAANARRLGVMYVIWNRKIWGSYANASGWRTYTGSNPHTDHVHISLSRAGGAGTTSFWTGRANSTSTTPTSGTYRPTPTKSPAPKPRTTSPILPAPTPPATLLKGPSLQDETVTVPPTRAGVYTKNALEKGQRYRVEVRGTWKWNTSPGSLADGECSTTDGGDTWWVQRWLKPVRGDQLGLYLDGRDLSLRGYASDCASRSHTYAVTITPARTGRVPLRLYEPTSLAGYANNRGALKVRIIRDVARDVLPVTLDVSQLWGTTTPGSVVEGATYRVRATGTWTPEEGTTADATCQQQGDEFRNGSRSGWRKWRLVVGDETMSAWCRDDHTYEWTFTAERSGPLVVRIDDREHSDNSGTLQIVLTRERGTTDGSGTSG